LPLLLPFQRDVRQRSRRPIDLAAARAKRSGRQGIAMHDVLRQRVIRRLESLPEEQIYQVLDYIEFLESKYARSLQVEASGLQRFAEGLEDRLRKKALSPHTLREAFQLIAAADRVLSSVSSAGREILNELGARPEGSEEARAAQNRIGPRPAGAPARPAAGPEGVPGSATASSGSGDEQGTPGSGKTP
jgi:hypothetical protein